MADFFNKYGSIIIFILILVIMYIILIRPQKKREREFRNMLDALKVGDKIVTIGGIVGVITYINEKEVKIKTGDDVELMFIRDAISRVVPPDSEL